MNRVMSILITVIGLLVLSALSAGADVPPVINYQGFLTTTGPNPVGIDKPRDFRFSIWPGPTTPGSPEWGYEVHVNVGLNKGVFSVRLGDGIPLGETVFEGPDRWLQIEVRVDDQSPWDILNPRVHLTTVPYAFRVATVDSATGGTITGDLEIKNGMVGIGIANPTARLSVWDATYDVTFDAYNSMDGAIAVGGVTVGDGSTAIQGYTVGPNSRAIAGYATGTGGHAGWFYGDVWISGTTKIGTGLPSEKLDVTGNIKASGWIQSGSSIVIDGTQDKITATSGTIDFEDENLTTTGTVEMGGFKMPTGSIADYVLTSDANGVGTWRQVTGGGGSDGDWERGHLNANVLYSMGQWGIARNGNILFGIHDSTHTNFGVDDTTGSVGQNLKYATVSGGLENVARGEAATVGGGQQNTAGKIYATVGGGKSNNAGGGAATVGGGQSNSANASHCTVGGGAHNLAFGEAATVGGGQHNSASKSHATVGGGYTNSANGLYSTVSGGKDNSNSGDYATILAGNGNQLTPLADLSMAFGQDVYINTPNRVIFFDCNASGYLGINRDDNDGGVLFPIHVGCNTTNGNGAHLTKGGTWTSTSSRTVKENFQPLDGNEILDKLSRLPVEAWDYIGTAERHIGPMAEEFVAAFDVGSSREDGTRDNKHLSSGDVAGVALAAIKELYKTQQVLTEKLQKIDQLEAQVDEFDELKAELAQLKNLVEAVVAKQDKSPGDNTNLAMNK